MQKTNIAATAASRHSNQQAHLVRVLFVLTLCLSAFLLFLIQPQFTKLVLPLLGGAPAIWNTAMVFFQALLLAGYIYAHFLSETFSLKRQILIHLAIMLIAAAALPIAISQYFTSPSEDWPIVWLLGLFMVSIGAPFFIISANAPLLQNWFRSSGDPSAADPYFLYAASNIGSMAALFAYPLFIEIRFGLSSQGILWSGGFALLFGLILICGLLLRRRPVSLTSDEPESTDLLPSAKPTTTNYLSWILLGLIPSALLLSVTNKITTDLIAMPLLWVIPLALYLLTFVIAFARRPWISNKAINLLAPYFLLAAAIYNIIALSVQTILFFLAGNLVCFFIIALYCHSQLVTRRPDARYLTRFYIAMSLGGVLGGILVGILAPLLFSDIYEYALLLIVAALLMPQSDSPKMIIFNKLLGKKAETLVADIGLPVLVLVFLGLVNLVKTRIDFGLELITFGLFTLIIILLVEGIGRPIRFTLGIVFCLFYSGQLGLQGDQRIFHERSFFGVYSVMEKLSDDNSGEFVRLAKHGTTVHGIQITNSLEPLSYYHRNSGVGRLFESYEKENLQPQKVAAIGLGAGTVLCYGQEHQQWTFFEIDPLVERLARDTSIFTYLENCPARAGVVIGDGRLSLQNIPDSSYDLLIADAFSSDAIPLHLLTKEAFEIYGNKVGSGGIILLHISNRFFDLESAVATTAQITGLHSRIYRYVPTAEQAKDKPYHFLSSWVALSKDRSKLDRLIPLESSGSGEKTPNIWRELASDPDTKIWSDDYSNILSALK
ncbi:spermidine synthase [Kiloniella laminariae]|uniref:spermidine synthase n=1 Tax=Kiloniella laminariae TaxID=454162 RepID=UPI0003804557|nr:fused MFS/spermidine synthase [Kiloniella laminariae]